MLDVPQITHHLLLHMAFFFFFFLEQVSIAAVRNCRSFPRQIPESRPLPFWISFRFSETPFDESTKKLVETRLRAESVRALVGKLKKLYRFYVRWARFVVVVVVVVFVVVVDIFVIVVVIYRNSRGWGLIWQNAAVIDRQSWKIRLMNKAARIKLARAEQQGCICDMIRSE